VIRSLQAETLAANKPFIDRIAQLAQKKKATTAQLSLAWLLASKPFIVPIPWSGQSAASSGEHRSQQHFADGGGPKGDRERFI